MGNVHASSMTPPPPPPVSGSVANEKPEETPVIVSNNPGTVEDLHKKCKDLFPSPFEGARVNVNKGLSNHFQVSHTLNMSSMSPSGYRFGATYVGSNIVGPGEAYPVMLGDIDPSGNLNANIIHQLHPNIKTKLAAQFQDSKCAMWQSTTDFMGGAFTSSATLVNIDPINSSGLLIGHHLHRVLPNIDLGGELITQFGPQIPGGRAAAAQLCGRYTSSNYVVSGSISPMSAHLCYYQKANENLQFGVELESSMTGETLATFGYALDVPKADISFKASIDSNMAVCGVLEKKLLPLPLTLILSGHVDHASKSALKLGCGLLLG